MRYRRRIAVLGDLHYEPEYAAAYRRAQRRIAELSPDRVFQLGDQGGYSHCGSWQSFTEGREFLAGIGRPAHTIIGNHDLEGEEFGSDRESVRGWMRAFDQQTPWQSVDLGDALAICLSSTRFRDNPWCHHEVHIDRRQMRWLRATLKQYSGKPTFVFSHAPPLGSNLRVLQSLHLKCPNAWLNHTDRPEQFLNILRRNPQIKLWFSAHNHLGQLYADSTSEAHGCTFVHTGVIGHVGRDVARHSRLVDFDANGFELSTIDHGSGDVIANMRRDYASGQTVAISPASQHDTDEHFGPAPFPTSGEISRVGGSVFALHRGMLVEYDAKTRAPLGVVADRLTAPRVEIRQNQLHIRDEVAGAIVVAPNEMGRYLRVYAPNPWRKTRLSA